MCQCVCDLDRTSQEQSNRLKPAAYFVVDDDWFVVFYCLGHLHFLLFYFYITF